MQDWAASSGRHVPVRAHPRRGGPCLRPHGDVATTTCGLLAVRGHRSSSGPRLLHKPAGTAGRERRQWPDGAPAVAPVGADTAIEIILDTSGSMLDKLEGRRRIDIAQSVLTHLVQDKLPVGCRSPCASLGARPAPATPVSRCRSARSTRRSFRLHPGSPILSSVNTPLGMRWPRSPTTSPVSGPRIVVLVTDGKRTAAGMPPQPSGELVRAGDDVHVNIVGFALDQRSIRKALAAWARAGHALLRLDR